ncbi:zinc finger matrin-type protein 5-like [Littorina saxatilis]|uniref:C3H1-type domain-containing protein n=1 Tax=Littorina saxatilis TaxID=31220 RepID=A0AAN9FW06_9CAEN
MGKRYYCDFCEKAFADNAASKKNHFNGAHHHRMRKAHYDNFRDPASILSAEMAKKPCRKFLQTGNCEFGNGCRFSHLTEGRRRELEQQCQQNKEKNQNSGASGPAVVMGELDDWLTKHSQREVKGEDSGEPAAKRRKTFPDYSLPPHLVGIPNLPPSLLPPTRDDFVNLPLLEWG